MRSLRNLNDGRRITFISWVKFALFDGINVGDMRDFILDAKDWLGNHRLCVAGWVKELTFDFDVFLFLVLAFLYLIRAWTWNTLYYKTGTVGIGLGADANRMQPEPKIGG